MDSNATCRAHSAKPVVLFAACLASMVLAIAMAGCTGKTIRTLDGDSVTISKDGDTCVIKAREGSTGETAVIVCRPGSVTVTAKTSDGKVLIEAFADGKATLAVNDAPATQLAE